MGTHLNCINRSMQFKWVPTTCAFIKKETKSTLTQGSALFANFLVKVCAKVLINCLED